MYREADAGVMGNRSHHFEMKYVLKNDDIEPGQARHFGKDGIYLRGLPVGVVIAGTERGGPLRRWK
jgi:cell shape-determining protein MreC